MFVVKEKFYVYGGVEKVNSAFVFRDIIQKMVSVEDKTIAVYGNTKKLQAFETK